MPASLAGGVSPDPFIDRTSEAATRLCALMANVRAQHAFSHPLAVALLNFSSQAAATPPCSAAATAQAGKLLAFHSDVDGRIAIDEKVRHLPSVRNPGSDCVLMGQEILEHAQL